MSNREEISRALTLRVRDTCLCLHVQRAARAVARHYDEALRPAGLTNGQFSLMMSLNRPQPPTISEVAELLGVDRTTLTASLKALERRRLVKVAVDAADRRSRRLALTPAGRAALAAAVPLWEGAQAAIECRLDDPGPDRLRAVLRALG
jgi:DNA-binding MarR family transcriptional regulator